jgi:D-alanine-D-alanine ligase
MRIGSELKNRKVGVLMGGMSASREVSIQTGEAVYQTLVDRDYKVCRIHADRDVDLAIRQAGIEVAFLALHGRYGEDGCIQGLLEIMGIPYTGSGVTGSALAMDKVKSKEIFRLRNLPTPPYYVLSPDSMDRLVQEHSAFGFPVVVKPCSLGSSVGVSVARSHHELNRAAEQAFLFDTRVMVERYIRGVEVQVAVLEDRVLGGIEVVPREDIYDYRAKTHNGQCELHLPARLSATRYQGVLTQARKAHEALGCSSVSLVDMILGEEGNEFILEVNSQPALNPTGLTPRIAHGAGLEFGDLVEAILATASLKAHREAAARAADLAVCDLFAGEAHAVGAAGPN